MRLNAETIQIDRNIVDIKNCNVFQFRNLFFKAKFRGQEVGIDGLLLDIMRTRDGGVAPYIDFYPMCLNKKIESWSDLEPFFEKSHFKLLRQLYKNIRDIDLMVGILMEKRNKNQNMLTKIGGCIVAKQFFNFKYGDRFFYSHHNNPNRFSKGVHFDLFTCLYFVLM